MGSLLYHLIYPTLLKIQYILKFLGFFSILPIAYCSPFGNFLRKFSKVATNKNSVKNSKNKSKKRKSKKWQKLKQVNTLFETITSIPPSTTLFCYKKTTTTERMPLCDLDPPFFAKNNKK